MSRLVLLDNTVLSNFARARIATALFSLWKDRICSTPEIMAEYAAGIVTAGLPKSVWKDLKIIEQTKEEKAFGGSLSARLGTGERSCMAIAHARGATFATDDLYARETAKRYNISVIGTLGILAQCVTKKALTHPQAQNALDLMIAGGYHSPIADIMDLWR